MLLVRFGRNRTAAAYGLDLGDDPHEILLADLARERWHAGFMAGDDLLRGHQDRVAAILVIGDHGRAVGQRLWRVIDADQRWGPHRAAPAAFGGHVAAGAAVADEQLVPL